ncbi:MAG TPA: fibronectin type III domain-containing protein, partial [Acidimicrobiales bacterium]|nr:fibronectin type III domain-containing protein [Acidimicrobiales bacterium]
RVAVSPPEGTPAPVAVSDAVTAAPGAHVSVNVLANDIIAPGDAVTILPLARTNTTVPAGATVDGTSIDVVAPTGTEPLVFTYGITDGRGAPSLAQVVVTAGPPGYDIPPVAVDDYATAPPAGQNEVSVKVLANDYDPDGTPGDLTLVAVFSPNAHIDGDQVVVVVGPAPQTIGYEIKDPGGATAIGVVHVPAVDVGPHLKAGAPTIQVPATGSVTVSLADYITDTRGSVRLTSADGISTSPSSGLAWHAVDYTSLSLSAIGGYGGPGSLTVQVTDGTSPNQPGAYTTYVTLPVQVGAPTPVLRCPSTPISVAEGGTAASVDLTTFCQVWTPDPAQAASLSFTATWAQQPNDVSTGWADAQHTILTVTAGSAANPNQTGTLKVDIAGTSVSTEFPVVVTSVPPATATPVDVPGAQTGKAVTVDMRQYVTSPLPSPSVTVLGVTPQQGGVTATTNGSTITFTPQTGTHGTVSFTVQVTDVAGRPERAITDTVTLEVLDVPSAPGAIAGVPGNQQVALSWGAAQPNGSPIQKYVVSMGGSQQSVTGTSYTWTGLTNGTSYTFTVVAVNGVGPGAPVTSTGFSPQSIPGSPGAVQAVPKNQEVDLTWGAAPDNGVAIDHYLLSVNPAPPGGASQQTVGGSATSFAWTGLSNDVGPYTFTVVPHNSLGAGPSVSSSPVYTFGTPATPPAPTATGSVSLDQTTTTVTVSFPAISPCNDAQACAAYTVTEYKSGAKQSSTTAVSTCGGGMCATFGPLTNDGADYTYTVTAANREGLTSPESAQSAPPVKADGVPGPITDLAASAGNQQLTATFTVPAAHGASIAKVDYQAVSAGLAGSWTSVPAQGSQASFTLSGLVNGQSYPLQARACNDNSECGAWSSISTAATAVPYGPPNPPQATATMGNSGSITFGWSGGGGNGRPVDHYVVCIDKSCSNYPASSTSTTQTYACSQSHSVAVSVVDTVGQQSGQASATGSTATCKPPNPPQVSATNGNTGSITYSWSGGGGQGLPLDHYVVCIDGSCSNYPTSTTSTTQAYACGQTHTLGVTAVDSAGQSSTQATATGSTAACPPPTTSPPPSTSSETESPNHGVNTFQDYHNASGPGPAIAAGQTVQVSCKVYDPTIASSNPDGYWYRIASSPWNNGYYATANTFLNGGGTTTNVVNTDMSVPNC